ncbi:unnamed protein product [Acanthosepion pharaonis]|uniref:CABIT domain-containing protein n=1 Tax=Acanthosepion pharaonis TaxID=158019 RepID=A0A812CIK7_ACAPH|nr:unnamed protein product [Sepia pharaonis]
MGRGTIVPLYGESHVCNTVEELIMTFPRYVLIEENLKICSESKFIQLQAGSELELLRNSKDKYYQDKLICRYGDQTLKLKPSDIGRFRVRPDPNLYSVKDILQRLKLPQIIDFKEILQDQWEKDVNFFDGLSPEQSYTGKFLLTGLFKDKAAVVVALGPNSKPNTQPFILPLSSDLIQQLKFRFAFRGEFSQFHFKGESNSLTRMNKKEDQKKKNTKKKETHLKRGKSEADITQSQQIPFELTYTQYRFPESADKSKQGDKIFKKVQSAVKSVKGIFKKASSQDVAAIRNSVLKIRRHSPFKKRGTSSVSSEEMSQDSNWNAAATDEKSDFSTGEEEKEEEESYTENSPSVNINEDVYEFEVISTIPKAAFPVPPKRKLKRSSEVAVADGCSSDACDDIKTNVSNSNEKESAQLEDMSVQELCEILHECGLSRISKMCKEHSLDGAFLCALPDDSLQEQPFSLTHLEMMKITMMKKGWKPKIK